MGVIADKVATMRGCSLREIVDTIAEMEADDPTLDIGDTGFHEFWQAYPMKSAKPAALKAYKAARKRKHRHKDIMEGLRVYIATKPQERDWCMAATFLNQDRFCDIVTMTEQATPRTATVADMFNFMGDHYAQQSGEGGAGSGSGQALRQPERR